MRAPLARLPRSVTGVLVAGSLCVAVLSAHPALAASAAPTPITGTGHPGLLGAGDGGWMADKDLGSLYTVTRSAGVQDVWDENDPTHRRVTGKGVGVALIDSGI